MRKIHSSVRIYEKTKRSKEFFLAAVNTSAIYFKAKAVNENHANISIIPEFTNILMCFFAYQKSKIP